MCRRLERVERDATDPATQLFARQAATDFAVEVAYDRPAPDPRRAARRPSPRRRHPHSAGRARTGCYRAGGADARRRLAAVRDPRAEVAAPRVIALEPRIQQAYAASGSAEEPHETPRATRAEQVPRCPARSLAVEPASTFERRVASCPSSSRPGGPGPTPVPGSGWPGSPNSHPRVALGEARSAATDRRLVERHRVRRQGLAEIPHALVVKEARRHAATALRLRRPGSGATRRRLQLPERPASARQTLREPRTCRAARTDIRARRDRRRDRDRGPKVLCGGSTFRLRPGRSIGFETGEVERRMLAVVVAEERARNRRSWRPALGVAAVRRAPLQPERLRARARHGRPGR